MVWPFEAFFIGLIGGFVAVTGVIMFDKLKVDDPVGAISVHGLAGIWVSGLKALKCTIIVSCLTISLSFVNLSIQTSLLSLTGKIVPLLQ